MLPPHELKNKSFSKAMRGYNPIEVDEYVDFLIEKYTELYRANDELERRLKATETRLDEIRNDEDSIRSALVDAKRAAGKIKEDAEERAEAIIRAAKSSCNTILADFNDKILLGRDTISELRRDAVNLKKELFEKYSEHIRYIESLTDNAENTPIPEVSELNKAALESLKAEIFETYKVNPTDAKPADESSESVDESIDSIIDAARELKKAEEAEFDFDEGDALSIERSPLVEARSIKEQALQLGKSFKNDADVIHTPDSDPDDSAYMAFIKSVSGGETTEHTAKDDDFDMLFNETKKISR